MWDNIERCRNVLNVVLTLLRRRSTMVCTVIWRWCKVETFSKSLQSCFDVVRPWCAQWDDVEGMLKRYQSRYKVFWRRSTIVCQVRRCWKHVKTFSTSCQSCLDVFRPCCTPWIDVEWMWKCSQRNFQDFLMSFNHGVPSRMALMQCCKVLNAISNLFRRRSTLVCSVGWRWKYVEKF